MSQLAELPETLPLASEQDSERLQAALVLPANGDYRLFLQQVELAQTDWRDALVAAGLGGEDWRARLDALLGEP